jgi:protein-tyrosine phosphatase
MTYVKLSEKLYYGMHPSIIFPDIKGINNFIDLTEADEYGIHSFDLKKATYKRFQIKDHTAPSIKKLTEIYNYIKNLNGKVYISCKGGCGRSGVVAAIVYGKANNMSGTNALNYINNEWHNQRWFPSEPLKRYSQDINFIRPQITQFRSPETKMQKDIVKKFLDECF